MAERRRLAVRVTPDAERHIRGGHPWVFDRSIISVSHDGEPGDLAVIFDKKRRFVAIGLYDPTSPIRVRILHRGEPTPIDADWWRERVAAALDHRAPLVADPTITGYRWVHGENDGLGGLVVDRYDRTLVAKIYSPAWTPHLPAVVEALVDIASARTDGVDRVVLRRARSVDGAEGAGASAVEALFGDLPSGEVEFLEHGLVFGADPVHGHKTGYFLDQRDNRTRAGRLAEGRRVLDVFSAAGGFTVHAAAGGATEVVSVDRSRPALDAARRNLERNAGRREVAACRHRTVVGDAAEEMVRLARHGERFGLVVVDPPAMATRSEHRPAALRAYRRLGELALGLVEPGGTLVAASCSSRVGPDEHQSAIEEAARASGRSLRGFSRWEHALDHPIGFPEGRYLTAVFATVD